LTRISSLTTSFWFWRFFSEKSSIFIRSASSQRTASRADTGALTM